jgi:uncharacterized protein YjeT (DUF2065 family)
MERLLFGALGTVFIAFAAWQASRSLFGVAIFLATVGLLALVAVSTLSDSALRRAGLFFIFVNVVVAAIALYSGANQ